MTDRFRYQHHAARFSDRIEWLFFDSLRQERIFLVFCLQTRTIQAERTAFDIGRTIAPAWTKELEASLPPEAMAEAIGISLTLK